MSPTVAIDSIAAGHRTLDPQSALAVRASESATYGRLIDSARRAPIAGRRFYVVEGDLLLDEVQLAEYALRKDAGEEAPVAEAEVEGQTSKLLGISRGGKMVRWRPGLALSYFIARETFPTTEQYQTVRDNIRTACDDWMAVCGIEFDYRGAHDNDVAGRDEATIFSVSFADVNGQFIAAAFFPDDPPERRVVLVDPSYFSPTLRFNRVGVLRHELGHVLGFRHEHIRSEAPAACPGEPLFGTTPLTEYDPRSVMHYFCGDVGSDDLDITEVDRQGARRLYGSPLSSFVFTE